ncbi:MAG: hypothetical protein ACI9G9_001061 [Psychromonas sp.]
MQNPVLSGVRVRFPPWVQRSKTKVLLLFLWGKVFTIQ